MSDMSISSVSSAGGGLNASRAATTANASAAGTTAVPIGASPSPTTNAAAAASGAQSTSYAAQSIGASTSAFSMTLEQVDFNRMSAFVLALIAALFSDKDKKKEGDDAAAMLGLLMLSAMQPSVSRLSYYESTTSQTAQGVSANNVNAVQPTPYSVASGGAATTTAGGSIDVSA